MELREFAERVLYGESLEEKLASPASFEDTRRGAALARPPRVPGRPKGLRLDGPRRAKVPFPGVSELTSPRAVGQVLHFFANHELLAMELMALVLLRFPEAPEAFRRGVAHTLVEEQEHMRLYQARMEACGVAFGAIPVNAYFWRCIAPMASPMDFVTQMSLTFEQANLDFSLEYQRAFEQIGDAESAALMQRVYEDEIGHVGHGLAWFHRWRDGDEGAFEAFERLLPEPLTPRRAKGRVYATGARRAAGFDEAFIERLAVYSASRGRAPALYHFNPSCEAEIIYGPGHTERTHVAAMRRDLEALPLWLAGADDAVLVERAPRVAFLRALQEAGVTLPQFIEARSPFSPDAIPHAHLASLQPWGWSPAAVRRFEALEAACVRPTLRWGPDARRLFSKALGAELLREHLERQPSLDALSRPESSGRVCESAEATTAALSEVSARGHEVAVIKAAFGASGQNAIRVRGAAFEAGQRGWLSRVLRQHGAVVVEPWLERVLDLSGLFRVLPDGTMRFDGVTRFETDARGQYLGHHVGRWTAGLPSELLRFIHAVDVEAALERAAHATLPALRRAGFEGRAGIDAFLYRDREGALRLRPLVELNPRHTMGHVALALTARVAPRSTGSWRLLRVARLRSEHGSVEGWAEGLRQRAPVQRDRLGRITAGALFTTDPARAEQVVSVLEVG